MTNPNDTDTTVTDETLDEPKPGVTLTITGPRAHVETVISEMNLPFKQVGETITKDHPDPEAQKHDIVASVVLLSPFDVAGDN
jgi:hypothetical protein